MVPPKKTLKELRLEKGYTQEKLAYKAGISLATLISTETFRRKPSLNTMEKLVKVLEVDLWDIIWTNPKSDK